MRFEGTHPVFGKIFSSDGRTVKVENDSLSAALERLIQDSDFANACGLNTARYTGTAFSRLVCALNHFNLMDGLADLNIKPDQTEGI